MENPCLYFLCSLCMACTVKCPSGTGPRVGVCESSPSGGATPSMPCRLRGASGFLQWVLRALQIRTSCVVPEGSLLPPSAAGFLKLPDVTITRRNSKGITYTSGGRALIRTLGGKVAQSMGLLARSSRLHGCSGPRWGHPARPSLCPEAQAPVGPRCLSERPAFAPSDLSQLRVRHFIPRTSLCN